MHRHIVDSSGWIEYFQDTARADWYEAAILDTDKLIVPAISIYEVHKRLSQLCPASVVQECIEVMQQARVINLTPERAIVASQISIQHNLAMADAMIYAIALEFDALFFTQDADYQGLPHVEFYQK